MLKIELKAIGHSVTTNYVRNAFCVTDYGNLRIKYLTWILRCLYRKLVVMKCLMYINFLCGFMIADNSKLYVEIVPLFVKMRC